MLIWMFYVLDYSGSFDMHIEKYAKITEFAVWGGGLRTFGIGPHFSFVVVDFYAFPKHHHQH